MYFEINRSLVNIGRGSDEVTRSAGYRALELALKRFLNVESHPFVESIIN